MKDEIIFRWDVGRITSGRNRENLETKSWLFEPLLWRISFIKLWSEYRVINLLDCNLIFRHCVFKSCPSGLMKLTKIENLKFYCIMESDSYIKFNSVCCCALYIFSSVRNKSEIILETAISSGVKDGLLRWKREQGHFCKFTFVQVLKNDKKTKIIQEKEALSQITSP